MNACLCQNPLAHSLARPSLVPCSTWAASGHSTRYRLTCLATPDRELDGEPPLSRSSRRGFLAGTLGAATALSSPDSNAAPATAGAPSPPPPPPPPPRPQPQYQSAAGSGSPGPSCGKGAAAIRDPSINRGCATAPAVREELQLQGLLPPRQVSKAVELQRAAAALELASTPLEKHRLLIALKETNQEAFYALLQQNISELLPIVYTPTIGDACLNWGRLIPRPAGLYITADDAGRVDQVVANWPQQQVRIAVVTDGERILGLGDLGAHGMGIPVGKSIVYGLSGVNPDWLLPVTVDVGTENEALLEDPLYVGLPRRRVRGEAYFSLMREVVSALQRRYGPRVLIHWEDVSASNAFSLLQQLKQAGVPTYNDDIQCTAAVAVAAVLGALRLPGVLPLQQQRFLFLGAGQANLGMAQLLVRAMQAEGLAEYQARARIWLIDSKGLITKGRADLTAEKAAFAQDPNILGPAASTTVATRDAVVKVLPKWVEAIQPTALIGAAAVGGAFSRSTVEALTQSITKQAGPYGRPILFALSNPTSKSEVTFEQAVQWTGGRAVFASGSPFQPLYFNPADSSSTSSSSSSRNSQGRSGSRGSSSSSSGRLLRPGQANNCLVFPGLGLGCVASGAAQVNDDMLLATARAIAGLVSAEELSQDCILPDISRLQEVTTAVAAAVATTAAADQLSSVTVDSTRCLPELQAAGAPGAASSRSKKEQQLQELACVKRLQFVA